MSDCPHIHIQDSGLQAFREIILEETDGGRDIVRFLNGAVNQEYANYKAQDELKAAEILAAYGFKVPAKPVLSTAEAPVRQHDDPKPKPRPVLSRACPEPSRRAEGRSPANTGASAPALKKPGDTDPAIDDFAQIIRDETQDGLTIVRNLVRIMESREKPYMPNHNLDAAKQLIENGFPITGDMLCSSECTHHSPSDPESDQEHSPGPQVRYVDPELLAEARAEIQRMKDEGILTPDPNRPKIDISSYLPPEDFDFTPHLHKADEFWAKMELRYERQQNWPEIEERRRKKLEEMYPSHSNNNDSEDPPDT